MDVFNGILTSALCGIIGTMTGGVLTALIPMTDKTETRLFSISGGMMLGLALSHMLPEAIDRSPIFALVGALCGFVIMMIADETICARVEKSRNDSDVRGDAKYLPYMIFAAIALHNIPEGIAIGAGSHTDLALVTAIAIGIHNIPEGMSVALPVISSGKSRIRAVLFAATCGTPTLLGGLIGALVCDEYASLLPLSLGAAAGAMTAVTLFELFRRGNDAPATSLGIGLAVALAVI